MSGTGFGTVVLHVSPEAADGGTLGIVQDGDEITLDVYKRLLHLHVSDEEIGERKKNKKVGDAIASRGYVHLYLQHVQGAHVGADMDFLRGGSGSKGTKNPLKNNSKLKKLKSKTKT